jgi:hypothetical protein
MIARPNRLRRATAAIFFGGLVGLTAFSPGAACPAATIRVDAGRSVGAVRAVHGVNGGPVCYGSVVDLSAYHRALGIPLTRIHDANWPARDVVDIHAIFPDFYADAYSPASYRFAPTDDYLKSILAVGSKVMYRLGESIEHTPRKYYVHKPPDFDHWAKICLGIIRHYNEGWADGFHFDLGYFEIWNEAEIGPAQWDGSADDYYRLYVTTAKAIKSQYPTLRVGGPAAAGLGRLEGKLLTPSPFLQGFLRCCKEQSAPLDFLSWHMYTADATAPARGTCALRRVLDDLGFNKTEIHLNEWNYLPDNNWGPMLSRNGPALEKWFAEAGSARGAAFAAAVLLELQDAPIDMANFYTGDNGGWGLFNVYGVPKKTYHAFRAFKALVDHPDRRAVEGGKPGELSAAAGMTADSRELALVVSNYRSSDGHMELVVENLPWSGRSECEVSLLDQANDLKPVSKRIVDGPKLEIAEELPAPGVLLVLVRRALP